MNSAALSSASESLRENYVSELRVHAITLIWLGYRRLSSAAFCQAEEDHITGELLRAMRIVLQDSASPDWVDHYDVREQVPQNASGRLGKRRPKVDIEVERHQRGPRACIGFEAKRLGHGHSMGRYLGVDGLGAFLSGHYPTTHREAGMIGYVQELSSPEWSTKLAKRLSTASGQHSITAGGDFKSCDVESSMPAFRSVHSDATGKSLLVLHVLLAFVS
jgi:hypothetical protein